MSTHVRSDVSVCLCASVVLLSVGLLGPPAAGQGDPVYRVTDLGVLSEDGDPESRALGLNTDGVVVGWSTAAGGETHAFLWLPEPMFGLAQGMHDLNVLPDPDLSGDSIAHAVNEGLYNGSYAVGQANDHAFVWSLGGGFTTYDLGTLSEDLDAESCAWGINDELDPLIVGDTHYDFGVDRVTRGFRNYLNGSMLALTPAGYDCGHARDVANLVTPQDNRVVVGFTYDGACGMDPDPCATFHAALMWGWPNLIILPDIPTTSGDWGAEALGTNDVSQTVGWGRDPDTPQCEWVALHWEDRTVGQPDVIGPRTGPDWTRANAIDEPDQQDSVRVVGANVSLKQALLWQPDGEDWTQADLNDLIASGCDWELHQAHDVSDESEWIVGYGDVDPGPLQVLHAFLLTPIGDCPADIDRDGDVDTDDLLELLGAWGGCPVGSICWADVNADCTVNTADLLLLLGAWGECGVGGGEIPQSVQDCIDKFGFDPIALEACIEAVTGGLE